MPVAVRALAVLVALVAVFAGLPLGAPAATKLRPLIIGGTPSAASDAPWMAALVARGKPALQGQFCGATVVAPAAVVTAAHCIRKASAADLDVVTGRTRLSGSGGERIAVRAIRVHPSYGSSSGVDAAVLLLARATSAPALPLTPATDARLTGSGSVATIFGWGQTANLRNTGSDELLRAEVVITPNRYCGSAYGGQAFDGKVMICAAGANDGTPDSCLGDSGGPLVAGGRLLGIVSYGGELCADPDVPGVYTRVSNAAAWITAQAGAARVPQQNLPPVSDSELSAPSLVLHLSRVDCGMLCRIEVKASGRDASSPKRVEVRIRQTGTGVDRLIVARRVASGRWRAQTTLPLGRVRIAAVARDDDGNPIGVRVKETIIVSS